LKKTSLYLDDEHLHLLRRISQREQRPQAEILRDAISLYAREKLDHQFALQRVGRDGTERLPWDGRSIGEIPDDELMAGFGQR
jgi:predicted DNA-binding protein